MRHIKSIIFQRLKTLNKKNINNNVEVDANLVCKKLEEIIKQKSTSTCSVLFYKNKEAHIKCFNSIVANELYFLREEIRHKINKFFNQEVLKKIIFKV